MSCTDGGCEKDEKGESGRDDGADRSSMPSSWSRSRGYDCDRLGTCAGDRRAGCVELGDERTVEASGVGSLPGASTLGGERRFDLDAGSRSVDRRAEGDETLLGRVEVEEVGDVEKEGSKRTWVGDIGINDYAAIMSHLSTKIVIQHSYLV